MTNTRPRLAVLIAAHNRRSFTLRALRALALDIASFNLTTVLLDDASSDGTSDAVRAEFPDTIILAGDGNAFWNGGMHRVWEHAVSLGFDGYLWLNDDVALDTDALSRLAAEWHSQGGAQIPFILVGATRDETGVLSYGGQRRVHSPFALKFEKLPVGQDVIRAETFNGNIVLVSAATVERIGINDPGFFHALGDIDYGLRASAAGIPLLVLPGTLGVCNGNPPIVFNRGPLRERWRRITSHRGLPPRNWWRMTRRYSGIFQLLHFVLPYRKLFF